MMRLAENSGQQPYIAPGAKRRRAPWSEPMTSLFALVADGFVVLGGVEECPAQGRA
jgi:hypothetical protein